VVRGIDIRKAVVVLQVLRVNQALLAVMAHPVDLVAAMVVVAAGMVIRVI
jgi:hypothetical protein